MLKHQNLHAIGDAWFWWVFEAVRLLCICSQMQEWWEKPAPGGPSALLHHVWPSKRECCVHIPYMACAELGALWLVGHKVLWFGVLSHRLFPFSEASKHPPHPTCTAPTQTDTCFLSFLIPLLSLGGIFPSIQLYKHWNWYSRLSCSFYCSIFSRRIQSVWSDRLGTFPRLSACCTNSRCV